MAILWIVAGVALVTGAFYLPSAGDVWAHLNAAGIAAGLYLFALAVFAARKPVPRAARLGLYCALALAGTAVVLCWTSEWRNSRSQKDWMSKIRTGVSRSVMIDEMPSILLNVMQRYYRQSRENERSIGELFREMHPGLQPGSNVHAPFSPE